MPVRNRFTPYQREKTMCVTNMVRVSSHTNRKGKHTVLHVKTLKTENGKNLSPKFLFSDSSTHFTVPIFKTPARFYVSIEVTTNNRSTKLQLRIIWYSCDSVSAALLPHGDGCSK
jgi:hypothetical protein